MKAFYSVLFGVVLSGCVESPADRFDRFMTELDCPVILIARTDKAVDRPTVVVRDGTGRVRTFEAYNGLPEAVSFSRLVGDTLKPCIDMNTLKQQVK